MEEFCKETLDWFSQFLDVSSGVPSHYTFKRVFSILNPSQFDLATILRKSAISLLKHIDPKKALILKIRKAAYSPEFRKKMLIGILMHQF